MHEHVVSSAWVCVQVNQLVYDRSVVVVVNERLRHDDDARKRYEANLTAEIDEYPYDDEM